MIISGNFQQIQVLVSEGIARGYVRPLTRIIFKPQEVSQAFRLLANSAYYKYVLLDLYQLDLHVLPR